MPFGDYFPPRTHGMIPIRGREGIMRKLKHFVQEVGFGFLVGGVIVLGVSLVLAVVAWEILKVAAVVKFVFWL